MRMSLVGRTLLAGLCMLLAACGNTGPSVAPAASPPSATSAGSTAVATTIPPPSLAVTSDLKIGVVTDIGPVHDLGVNESVSVGAADGAQAIGAASPPVVSPMSPSEYEPLVQSFVDQQYDVVVAAGSALQDATRKLAEANPETWFIGVDHHPCLDGTGEGEQTLAECTEDLRAKAPRYVSIEYAEDQAGYLAGLIAASASRSGIIGAIGDDPLCASCVRYVQGYDLGARSVDPNIVIKVGWLSDPVTGADPDEPTAGKIFTDHFIGQNPGIDVIFQVAGGRGDGIIDAACAAGVNVIGSEVDQLRSHPSLKDCILTSAEKRFAKSVADAIVSIDRGTAEGGPATFGAANEGIGLAPFYAAASDVPVDMQSRIDAATTRIANGAVRTCPPPPDCGRADAGIVVNPS